MGKLNTINTGIPQGRDKISDDPARQREIRGAIVETFGIEHHLTGEHKFPTTSTPDTSLLDGQISFDTTNGLLSFKDQDANSTEVFPIGSVRDFVISECWGHGAFTMSGLPVNGIGIIPSMAGSRSAFGTATEAAVDAQTGGFLGKFPPKYSSLYNDHTYTTIGNLGRLNLTSGAVYRINVYIGYFTSTATSAGIFKVTFTGVSGSATSGKAAPVQFSGFTTNSYQRPGPQTGVLTDVTTLGTIDTTGDYDLIPAVIGDANLGITSLGLRIERVG